MDLSAELDAPRPASTVFPFIEDLADYPPWMGLVHRAEPIAGHPDGDAWDVELRAQIGPLARSKRLTMVRTVCEQDRRVDFERRELDDREHSLWRLRAEITETPSGSHLTMSLHYGGGLWASMLAGVLDEEIQRSRDRLLALILETDEPSS